MSFQTFIEDHYTVRSKRRPGEFSICCPFCGDTKYHGQINFDRGLYYCYRCERSARPHDPNSKGLNAYQFLVQAHGLKPWEARKLLAEEAVPYRPARGNAAEQLLDRLDPPTRVPVEVTESVTMELPEGYRSLPPVQPSKLGSMAWCYLVKRFGIRTDDLVRQYNIGYCDSGRYVGRVILPVFEDRRLIYFQARTYLGQKPKYLNPSVENKPLYGLGYTQPNKAVIVVEGPMDVISLGRGSLSLLGSGLSTSQQQSLIRLRPSSITVALDPDEEGQRGARQLCEKLKSVFARTSTVIYTVDPVWWTTQGRDPASLGSRGRNLVLSHRVRYGPLTFEKGMLTNGNDY